MSLALAYQDAFKIIVRLQSGQLKGQSASHVKANLVAIFAKVNDDMAGRLAYTADELQDAKFALAAFADESALKSSEFKGTWNVPPDNAGLILSLFEQANAGNEFHRRLDRISRANTTKAGELLEVYALCLLLGYQGARTGEQLDAIIEHTVDSAKRLLPHSPDLLIGREHLNERTVPPRFRRFNWLTFSVTAALAVYLLFWQTLNYSNSQLSETARAHLSIR